MGTWGQPAVAGLASAARRAELDVGASGRAAPLRAVRELLAAEPSDWAFHVTRDYAPAYGRDRAEGHVRAVAAALAGDDAPALRDLAPWASAQALLEP